MGQGTVIYSLISEIESLLLAPGMQLCFLLAVLNGIGAGADMEFLTWPFLW